MKIPQMCQRFKDKNAFYTKTLESISPRFICPLSPGNFIFKEAAVDLEYLLVQYWFIVIHGYYII